MIRYHLWDGGSEAFGQMPRARDSFQVDLTGFLLKLGSAGPARMGAKVSLEEGSEEPEQSLRKERGFVLTHSSMTLFISFTTFILICRENTH